MPADAGFHAGDRDCSTRRSPAERSALARRSGLLGLALTLVVLVSALLSPVAQASNKRPNGELTATCHSITFRYFGFPNLPGNTVTEMVTVHHELVETKKFTFNGSEGEDTIPITVPPGLGQIDGKATWNTNGFKSSYDISVSLNCSDPGFAIEKEQEVEGSGEGFTKNELVAAVGKTVLYKIIVKNTGNTNLTFEKFIDKHCESVTGGPTGEVKPGETTIYFCKHTLTEADYKFTQLYENQATVTGKPPRNFGTSSTHKSNIVLVRPPKPNERPNGEVNATCTSITFTYRKFPNLPNNMVTEKVFINGTLILTKVFTFNGPNGEDTIPIHVPPGPHNVVDGKAIWNTNGFSGNWDIHVGVACSAEPSFAIGKFQKIEGGNEEFTQSPLTGAIGQTILYRVVVKNTGNVPETFSNFTDAHCSGIAGGPTGPLGIEESATYTCSHTIVLADAGHEYENSATVTGTPSEGAKSTETSNTVKTNVPFVPEPNFSMEKSQRISGSFTTGELSGAFGETIEYEIVVKNTGNVPLTLSNFRDTECNEGTIKGATGEIPVKGEFTYTCTHLITEADEKAGQVANVASEEGTPPKGDGSTFSRESNTVVTKVPFVPRPNMSVVKAQRIGSESKFTTSPLHGEEGETIEYAINVENTGNVPLKLSEFSDPNCGTVSGGPFEGEELLPGATATYTCSHTITEADVIAESYSNSATVTGTPPEGDGAPLTKESNTVVATTNRLR